MALAVAERTARMSLGEFLAFYDTRPDEERWELYDGVPLQVMTPPFPIHQRIGSNLERLFNNALAVHDPSRMAWQRVGAELPESGTYRPEPDVIVTDYDLPADRRHADRAYLFAEIVSSTDREKVRGLGASRIELKREIYRRHASCEAFLLVEQDSIDLLMEVRTGERWAEQRLTDPHAEVRLPGFGPTSRLEDIYADTPLGRRRGSGR